MLLCWIQKLILWQVGYNLNIVNQREAVTVSKELTKVTIAVKEMAQDTVDDSATAFAITIVSAFYLPASFVGVCPKISVQVSASDMLR